MKIKLELYKLKNSRPKKKGKERDYTQSIFML